MVNNKSNVSGRRKKIATGATKVERRKALPSRRKDQPKDDKELYKLPPSDIENFIARERRHDELDRIREVQEQKKVWKKTFTFCLLLNLLLLSLGAWGIFN